MILSITKKITIYQWGYNVQQLLVPGKRMPNTPVYILTSNFTFSAAEAIAQRLKVLKRAITIGENSLLKLTFVK